MQQLIEDTLLEETDLQEYMNLETEIKQDDYTLVDGKKKILYYVAVVVKKIDTGYEAKYLTKTGKNTF